MCRIRLASVNRELRQWSAQHGADLWNDLELSLTSRNYAPCDPYPERWAGGRWLEQHSAHIGKLSLILKYVRICVARAPFSAFLPPSSTCVMTAETGLLSYGSHTNAHKDLNDRRTWA